MASPQFTHLFSSIKIGGVTLPNRVMSTGHDTCLPTDGVVNDALVAYHEARAAGGTGLIVLQVSGVHETARYTTHMLMATEDDCIDGYGKLADAVHRHGTKVFAQLFHPGREIMEAEGGLLAVAYAPSSVPSERFHVMPRALPPRMIEEIVRGYADAARRMAAGGLDGVEIVASHGYLPSQFLNPRVNLRTDDYGGSTENRQRFLREIIAAVRAVVPEGFVVGLRISGDEMDPEGLEPSDTLTAIEALAPTLDYVNVIAGTSASLGGAIHIAPPMTVESAYLAPFAAQVKSMVGIPVFVAGRINQPQDAESIIAGGQADVCGMTRALICDADMPRKARDGAPDDIRACIGCNQACIGHFHRGLPVSCIQNPTSGRELKWGALPKARAAKRVMVVGGGPAGMKAAVTAAQRGHEVTLYEASNRLGGQALLAQLLPGRAEFGGLITNLEREMVLHGVPVVRGRSVDRALIESEGPDAVIVATGATPYRPSFEAGDLPVVDAWEVLRGTATVGANVVVSDWRSDWIGIGIAELLARKGSYVRLAVNGVSAGETLPLYVRDHSTAALHKLGIVITPFARLYGCDESSVYLQHTTSGEAMIMEEVDTLVLCHGHRPVDGLAGALADWPGEVHLIGDSLAPRTAEEAVYEGYKVAAAL